jgi:plasmid stability protein
MVSINIRNFEDPSRLVFMRTVRRRRSMEDEVRAVLIREAAVGQNLVQRICAHFATLGETTTT